ncbi:MAG: hypothetical protein R8L53_03985 [Mariprofundales bacterium]
MWNDAKYSHALLLQWVIGNLIIVGILLILREDLLQLYTAYNITGIGLSLNVAITLLFLCGMGLLLFILLHYRREEIALHNFQFNPPHAVEIIENDSLIAQRVMYLEALHARHANIDQAALAETLLAREYARMSTARYLDQVLILSGVFGTIVSLSMALMGASGLLQSAVNSEGMGMVIHGMSAALSTTMTAIFCYFFFHYFLVAAQNLRTRLLSSLEEITATELLPNFQGNAQTVQQHMLALIKALKLTVEASQQSQSNFDAILTGIHVTTQQHDKQMQQIVQQVTDFTDNQAALLEIQKTLANMQQNIEQQGTQYTQILNSISTDLRQGFRLSEGRD